MKSGGYQCHSVTKKGRRCNRVSVMGGMCHQHAIAWHDEMWKQDYEESERREHAKKARPRN